MQHTIREEADRLQNILDDDRLEDVQLQHSSDHRIHGHHGRHIASYLKLAVRTRNTDNSVVADDLSSDHGHRLALRWVDLARHDTAPGLVLRELQLTQTAPGTRAKVPDVVRDLHQRTRDGVERTVRFHERIMGGECLELEDEHEMRSGVDTGRPDLPYWAPS